MIKNIISLCAVFALVCIAFVCGDSIPDERNEILPSMHAVRTVLKREDDDAPECLFSNEGSSFKFEYYLSTKVTETEVIFYVLVYPSYWTHVKIPLSREVRYALVRDGEIVQNVTSFHLESPIFVLDKKDFGYHKFEVIEICNGNSKLHSASEDPPSMSALCDFDLTEQICFAVKNNQNSFTVTDANHSDVVYYSGTLKSDEGICLHLCPGTVLNFTTDSDDDWKVCDYYDTTICTENKGEKFIVIPSEKKESCVDATGSLYYENYHLNYKFEGLKEGSVEFGIFCNGVLFYRSIAFAPDPDITVYADVFPRYLMKEIRYELKQFCGNSTKSLFNLTLNSVDLYDSCSGMCDVFVSTLKTKPTDQSSGSYVPDIDLRQYDYFYVESIAYTMQGAVWRLCLGDYSLGVSEGSKNDPIVVKTHDGVLYDRYNDPNFPNEMVDPEFTVSCTPILNECKVIKPIDFSAKQIENDASFLIVKWNPDDLKDAIVDILDNGVLVAESVKGNDGQASFKLFNLQDGDEHIITIREQCVFPIDIRKKIAAKFPCSDPCTLSFYQPNDFEYGYVAVKGEGLNVTYFTGTPYTSPDANNPDSEGSEDPLNSLYQFNVCGDDYLEVKVILPSVDKAGDDRHQLNIFEKSSSYPPDKFVLQTNFAKKEEKFPYTCSACSHVSFASYGLKKFNENDEFDHLYFSDIKAFSPTMFVSVNGIVYQVDTTDSSPAFQLSPPAELYCIKYASCNETSAFTELGCLQSLLCEEPVVNFKVNYTMNEVLNISLYFEGHFIKAFNLTVRADNGVQFNHDSIISNPSVRYSYDWPIIGTELLKIVGGNVSVTYSLEGCNGTVYSKTYELNLYKCLPATVGNYNIKKGSNGTEVIELNDVKSPYGYLWISVNNQSASQHSVDPNNNIIIEIDNPRPQYCLAYSACNDSIDYHQAKCLDSTVCIAPEAHVEFNYSKSEYLNVNFKYRLEEPFNLDYIIISSEGSENISLTPDVIPSDGAFVFNVTDAQLKLLLGKNICVVYSFTGCGVSYNNIDKYDCIVLEKKSIVGLVVGITLGGLALAALLIGFIIYWILRPRNEHKEVEMEVEFPEDEEPDMEKFGDGSGDDEPKSGDGGEDNEPNVDDNAV